MSFHYAAKVSYAKNARVPNHTPVLDSNLLIRLVNVLQLEHTLIERLLRPEHSSIGLHGLLHRQPDFRRWLRPVRVPDLVQVLNAEETGFFWNLLMWLAGSEGLLDVVGTGTAEDDNIEQ